MTHSPLTTFCRTSYASSSEMECLRNWKMYEVIFFNFAVPPRVCCHFFNFSKTTSTRASYLLRLLHALAGGKWNSIITILLLLLWLTQRLQHLVFKLYSRFYCQTSSRWRGWLGCPIFCQFRAMGECNCRDYEMGIVKQWPEFWCLVKYAFNITCAVSRPADCKIGT